MATQPIAPEELKRRLAAFSEHGSIAAAARALGLPRTTMQSTLEFAARTTGFENPFRLAPTPPAPGRLDLTLMDGVVIVFSDAHWGWNTPVSTANRALLKFCKELKPKVIIANGDLIDGASISRHSPLQWEDRPTVVQELEVAKERLDEITVAGDTARRYWLLGNHCARFEARLATVAPEYARVHGFHLRDHFSADWEHGWSLWINGHTVIKHRYRSGVHGPHNNALWSGKNIVTGHRHGLGVWCLTDYSGTRFAVDTGTLARTFGPHTEYMEDNPRNHRSGLGVLTLCEGNLLFPEVVFVRDEEAGIVEFRGQVHHV